jgi:general secretion pathway protein N
MNRLFLVLMLLAAASPVLAQDAAGTDRQRFYAGIDLALLEATRDRPLFSESRRPPQPPPEPSRPEPAPVVAMAPAPTPMPPSLRLIGLVTMGETRVALVEDGTTGEILRLSPGATIDEWTMTIVDDRTIAFARDGEAARFALFAE